MRDRKREEIHLLEKAYHKVQESIGLGHGAQTASIGAKGPIIVGDEKPVEAEEGGIGLDIAGVAAQAIAAITQLAAAAGANISVTVDIGGEEIEELEVVDQFNVGYEDVGST
jgi:hypothetical protein